MTDPRTALEEAFKVVFPEPPRSWEPMPIQEAIIHPVQSLAVRAHSDWRNKVQGRFYRMLAAEAWTSAAEMLVLPGWNRQITENDKGAYATIVHRDASEECDDFVCSGKGRTTAEALAAACIKAKEAGDGR